jgi:endonuclease/exonuclease/phosphatase family metal-dependent hydrolase
MPPVANRLKLLSWNVAGRTRLLPEQIAAVLRREADVVALQEVRASTAGPVSWVMHTRARRRAAHRLDHVLASSGLGLVACDYVHEWRQAGLSDHSAVEAWFEPAPLQPLQ